MGNNKSNIRVIGKLALKILVILVMLFLFLLAALIHGERTTRNIRQEVEQKRTY